MDGEEHGKGGGVTRLGLGFGGKESLGKPRPGLLLLLPWVLGCQGYG